MMSAKQAEARSMTGSLRRRAKLPKTHAGRAPPGKNRHDADPRYLPNWTGTVPGYDNEHSCLGPGHSGLHDMVTTR